MILFLIITIVSSSLSYGINKCCPDGKILSNNRVCINSTSDINQKFHASLVAAGQEITFHQFPKCSGRENSEYVNKYENNGDGSISLNTKRVRKWYEYCVDYMLTNNVLEEKIIACGEKVELEFKCGKGPCIFKCCNKGAHLDDEGNCKEVENAIDWKFNASQEAIIGKYEIIYGFPRCSSHLKQYVDNYTLNSDRSISLNMERVINWDQYCEDYMLKKNNNLVKKMIICSDEEKIKEKCQKERCIFKCCGSSSNLNDDHYCIAFSKLYEWKFNTSQEAIIGKYRIVHGFPKCSRIFAQDIYEYELNSNGSISLSDNRVLNWDEYCVDYKQVPRDSNYIGKKVLGCRKDEFITYTCEREVCIFKCCDNGKYLDNTGSCIDSGNAPDWKFNTTQEANLDAYRLFPKFPECDRKNIEYVNEYKLYKDGRILLTTTNRVIDRFGYCGDYTLGNNNKLVEKIIVCKSDHL